LTISPADTSLDLLDETEDVKSEEKKPTKKRKSWGQELPTPKTNLPPRKRAKTEDEKEQRRIERVLRNRAAAQTSRERKRLEVEKLEGEKLRVEQQNQFLLQRLTQMEAENNRLNRQVAQLSAEIRGSRGSSPKSVSSAMASPTLTPTLFKQEQDDISLDRIPFPTPSMTDYSPSLKPTDLAESSDLTQHPAVSIEGLEGSGAVLSFLDSQPSYESHAADDLAAPLSDDDFRRLFHSDTPVGSDHLVVEDGLTFGLLQGGDLSAFPFDSLVDFDPEPVILDNVDSSIGLSDEAPLQTTGMHPSLGASTSRCDGQSVAASG
jgi:transcriptional activator HAC1